MPLLRLEHLLIVASLLVPGGSFVAASIYSRAEVLREGQDVAARTVAVMHEHVLKVFETEELVLARLEDRLAGMSWEQIATPEMDAFLAALKRPMEQTVSIWVADATGTVRAGSQPWDPTVTIAGREFFEAQRAQDAGTYVTAAFRGKATSLPSFAISRRRPTADGHFDGTIHTSLSPAYFTAFFARAAPAMAHATALFRADGAVLAREPDVAAPPELAPDSPIMRQIARHPEQGAFTSPSARDGVERLYAYRKVGTYPVYVGFGLETAALLSRWYESVAVFGAAAALASLTLLLVSAVALRRLRTEQAALAQLRTALDDLNRETTQRKSAEQRLAQAQKMEALGQLAGGIAHDFNNVLQAVSGGLSLIRRRAEDAASVQRLAAMAEDAVARGASITRRLLAFARQGTLSAEPVPAGPLLEGLHEMLTPTLGAGITVRLDVGPGLPPMLADRAQLETTLVNLAVNARDAMPQGGTLELAAHAEAIGAGDDHPSGLRGGHYVRLDVIDTGTGMDAATLARASEPFFTTKPPNQGTGLGLAMARGFAEQSGGAFAIRSDPGRGTTVTLWFPQADAGAPRAEPAQAASPAPQDGPARHVLVVDDDAMVRAVLAGQLEEAGYQVAEASDGLAALASLDAGGTVDVLVTDLSMPGMNGLVLIEEARRRRPGLPVMVLTGYADQATGLDVAALGGRATVLLRKPVSGDDLARAVAALLAEQADEPD